MTSAKGISVINSQRLLKAMAKPIADRYTTAGDLAGTLGSPSTHQVGLSALTDLAPTVLADVDDQMRVAREEIFGPVLCAMPFDDEADALKLANGTDFGLVAGIWTRDGGRHWHAVDMGTKVNKIRILRMPQNKIRVFAVGQAMLHATVDH